MKSDGTLDREEMKKVSEINVYLRDECGVPFSDAFHIAMLLVKNGDYIVAILTKKGEE
jgi:hypothetical protein